MSDIQVGGENNTGAQIGTIGGSYVGGDVHIYGSGEQMQPLPVPFQIPRQPTDFTGRENDLQQIVQYLIAPENSKPITGLVGLGGIGKTSVSARALEMLKAAFPDGILWADLEKSTPEKELLKFALAYGQHEAANKIPDLSNQAEFVRTLLADKHVLVVLDHAADSKQVDHLIPRGSQNRTLITSRNGKMLTNLGANIVPIKPFDETEGMAYLTSLIGEERMQGESEFAIKIIEQVGGVPLALAIAGGSIAEADLSLTEYSEMLEDEQTRLENLADWEDESRDIAATFELSYQSLKPPIQKLFGALSIFEGPDFSVDAVAAVTKLPIARVKLALGQLFSRSFVGAGLGQRQTIVEIDEVEGQGRYRMNTLLRIFAKQKMGDSLQAYQERAVAYFVQLATQNQDVSAYTALDLDWQNIEGALYWASENKHHDLLLQGTLALTHHQIGTMGFMGTRGYWREARQLLKLCLEATEGLQSPLVEATLLTRLGGFAMRQSDFETAELHLTRALELLDPLDMPESISIAAYACDFMGQLIKERDREQALEWVKRGLEMIQKTDGETTSHQQAYLRVQVAELQWQLGQHDVAQQAAEEGLQQLPTEATTARLSALIGLGAIALSKGELTQAVEHLTAALPLAYEINDAFRIGVLWLNMGVCERRQGALAKAITNFENALTLFQKIGNGRYQGGVSLNLGQVYMMRGGDTEAQQNLEQAVTIAKEYQLPAIEAFARSKLVDLAIICAEGEAAEAHLQAAAAICEEIKMAYLKPTLQRQKAQINFLQSAFGDALNDCQQALELATEQKDQIEQGVIWRVSGQTLSQQADVEGATAAFEKSLELLQNDPYEAALTMLAWVEHDPEDAQTAQRLEAAVDIFENLGAQRELKVAREKLKTG